MANFLLGDKARGPVKLCSGAYFAPDNHWYGISTMDTALQLRLLYLGVPLHELAELAPAVPLKLLQHNGGYIAARFCAEYFACVRADGVAPDSVLHYPAMQAETACFARYVRCILDFRRLLLAEDGHAADAGTAKNPAQGHSVEDLKRAADEKARRVMALSALRVKTPMATQMAGGYNQKLAYLQGRVSQADDALIEGEPFLRAAARILCDKPAHSDAVNVHIVRLMAQVYAVTCDFARDT